MQALRFMNDFIHYREPSPDLDVFSQHSDPLPFTEQYSLSTMSDSRIGNARSWTEEDIMLASSHPKKPTGRKKFKETRHPVYRGVRMRNSNRWVCEVREPNKKKRIWLGTYPTAEMAARAHDVAALALRGIKSCLNFADSAWRLPVPASNDSEDIQRAAAEAAEMFRPEEYDEENLNNQSMNNMNMNITADEVSAEDNNSLNNFNNAYHEQFTGDNMNETNWQWQTQPQEYQQGITTTTTSSSYYLDDEAVFDMPGLLNSMAEGLLLPPPPPSTWDNYAEDTIDMTLWDHSF